MKVTDKNYTQNIHLYSNSAPKLLLDMIRGKGEFNLLDLGCGDGAILYILKKMNLLRNKKVFAVDISEERIKRVNKIDDTFICFVSDACNLTEIIDRESIDIVIASQVIEHVINPQIFINEIEKVLKRDGYLYLTTVYKKKYGWYFYRNNNKWVLDPTHLREYTSEEELLDILKKYNFKIHENKKSIFNFPIIDFILKRILKEGFDHNMKILNFLRKIRIPILGYYNWELVLYKEQ